jgi:hypothetical protein
VTTCESFSPILVVSVHYRLNDWNISPLIYNTGKRKGVVVVQHRLLEAFLAGSRL